jgi:hypothetical protein
MKVIKVGEIIHKTDGSYEIRNFQFNCENGEAIIGPSLVSFLVEKYPNVIREE